MTFQVFENENVLRGLTDNFEGPQSGVSNQDTGSSPELNLSFPFTSDPSSTWLFYDCWIECELDAGMALHKPLPQSDFTPDTLATADINQTNFDTLSSGVNTTSNGDFEDIIQRMATSTYIFKLRGTAVRVSYKIPIPGLVSVAGVAATPAERQWARNVLIGNFGGVPMFRAEWDLWYYVSLPPNKEQLPPDNLAAHIGGQGGLPTGTGVRIPNSVPDWNAVSSLPTESDLLGGIPVDAPLGD